MSSGDNQTEFGGKLDSLVQVEALVQAALKHALLEERDVSQIMGDLNESQTPTSPTAFCRAAIQAGRMTRFQAKVLLSRDPDALSIGPYLLVDKLGQGGDG